MRHPLSVGLMMLAVLVAAGAQADAGLFDRLAARFGGESAVQTDEPTLAQPAPLVVPAAQSAQVEEPPVPAPEEGAAPVPVPDDAAADLESIELYACVRYDDKEEMHPCAVPVVVSVPDPCSVKHPFYWLVGDAPPDYCATGCGTCSACCAKPQVFVMICVPPDCPVPTPRVTHNERHYVYDYGRYSVEVKLHRDGIEVEYDND